MANVIHIDSMYVLITSILVLYVGMRMTKEFHFLKHYNIPAPVTGGLICSIIVGVIYALTNNQIQFDTSLRDLLLLAFFSTIGLSAKFKLLKEGGKALIVLIVVAAVMLLGQNLVGIFFAKVLNVHPAYGLLAGSISFAGGHGTSLAYAELFATEFGLRGTMELGMACATFGLILGGLVGGPVAKRLIEKHKLSGPKNMDAATPMAEEKSDSGAVTMYGMIDAIFLISVCIAIGAIQDAWFKSMNITLPGFLTAMFTGIILTNLGDKLKWKMDVKSIGLISDVSLQIFLAMSLMSLQLWTLFGGGKMIKLLMIFGTQGITMALFAYFIIFRIMGKNYDASVITAGVVGFGLGATPVGIANMRAVTGKHGPSPKAFLVVPLIGAFFLDIINAIVIQLYLALPIFS